jgi:hypothetical protein
MSDRPAVGISRRAGSFALRLLVMVVDGAGRTAGDRTDRGARPTSGYGSDGRATRGSHGNTPNGSAYVMMATVNGMVVVVVIVISCVGRGGRYKAYY